METATLPTSNISQFHDQLNNVNKHMANFGSPANVKDGNNIVKIKRNLVLAFSSDVSGCGHIRAIWILNYLNAVFAKSKVLRAAIIPFFYYQHEIMLQARSLFFPRTMSKEYLIAVKRYKELQSRYQYRMIYDIDDFVWQGSNEGEKIPDYNFGSRTIPKEIIESAVGTMEMMDTVCVSTEFLKSYLADTLKITKPIVVLPNSVPRWFYGTSRRPPITEKLTKPKFIYTGSPCHYDNQNKLAGDFDNAWMEFIVKNVYDDKIEFMCMGCQPTKEGLRLPWFFEKLQGRIHAVPWLNSYQYHLPILEYKPDFSFAPLVPNYFNYSKSDIRYIETCAFGAVFMGTTFVNGMPSPYDGAFVKFPDTCTVKDIEDRVFGALVYPDNFNPIIKQQYDYMDNAGRWLESVQYVNKLTSIF